MKKFLCALLALGMAFGMTFATACGDKGSDGNGSVSTPEASQSTENSNENSEISSEVDSESSESSSDEVTDESGNESSEESSDVNSDESSEDSSEDSSDVNSDVSGDESDGVDSESSDVSNEDDSLDDEEIFVPDYSSTHQLEEYFAGRIGAVTYNTGKDVVIESISTDTPIYLGSYSEDNVFTVDGGPYSERRLTILGQGGGVVQADGGTLVLRNLTIKNDTHSFELNYYRPYYAEFGGKVRFENCIIDCSIQLRNDAEAEFINCEIKSVAEDQYGVWVADGSATFDGCTFTGYRGIKVHEISGMDVETVAIKNCTFDTLTEKPALAIDFEEPIGTATITFENSEIINCAAYKQVPEVAEGIDEFFESKTPTTEFTFTATNSIINGEVFEFRDGEITYLGYAEY